MAAQRRSSVLCFQLEGVEGPGVEIGRGSYAVVEEYGFQGLLCVGKSIHKELYDNAPPRERETMLERFEAECEMLSRLRHPHIVQFLGVHFNEGSPLPVLLMERLHSTLAACVDRHGKLPDECCYSVLCDVGVGLRYLHGHTPNPIIHRDLTANNVLLTPDLAAKISDLGVARILNLNPARMTRLTKCPGTPSYMPPEALVERPIYSTKMDIFAYGNLMTHVFSGRWPIPAEIFRANPSNPHDMTPLTEVQRREAYHNDIGDAHPLMGLMRECLSNNPTLRPNIPEALHRVKEVMPQFPPSFENRAEVLQRIQADATRNSLNQQVSNLSAQVEQKEDELRTLSNENAILNEGQLQALSAQLEQLQKALNAKDRDISSLRMEVSSKDAALQAKDSIIAVSIRSEATRVETLLQRIQTLTDENAALNRRIASLSIYCVPMKPIPGQISESTPPVLSKPQTQPPPTPLPPPLPPRNKPSLYEEQRRVVSSSKGHHENIAAIGEVLKPQGSFFEVHGIYGEPSSAPNTIHDQLCMMKKYREIPRELIQTTEHLGSSQFGIVQKGIWQTKTGAIEIAVKTLKAGVSQDDEVRFLQEAAINGQFKHHNIVELLGVVTVGQPVMIVLELLSNGNLRSYLIKQQPEPGELLPIDTPHMLLQFCQEVASGMEYLSQKGFIHRDLAARNILVAADRTCKISEFGMSRDLEDETYYITRGGKIPVKWTAPEALHFNKYSTASDVWSYGVLVYEIWSVGYKPFRNYTNHEAMELVDSGFRLPPPPGCPKKIYKVMIHCWHPDTPSRPSFAEVEEALSQPEIDLLCWSEEDTAVHPQAAVLGAPLEAGGGLYPELQETYS